MKLITPTEMRAIEERAAGAGLPASQLMENAGRAVAEALREELHGVRARRLLVLVGPGNNGGDGLVAARHLYDMGAEVVVGLLAARPADDPHLTALRQLSDLELVDLTRAGSSLEDALARTDAVVDAVLGTGSSRPLAGPIAATFERLRSWSGPLFAVDLPTGVDGYSGAADPNAANATVTFALGYSKLGLHALPGSLHAGRVDVLDIGLGPSYDEGLQTELLTERWVRERLPRRSPDANKGSFGRVLVVAGSVSYTGAATLAALGALRAGAGLVTVATVAAVRDAVAAQLPEVTYLVLPEEEGALAAAATDRVVAALAGYRTLLIGPGLGQSAGARAVVRGVLSSPAARDLTSVVDADALNALAAWRDWPAHLEAPAVLTPHPGEMARLAASSVAAVQSDRLACGRERAAAWGKVVALKGAHTLVLDPAGTALVSPVATAALATAGTGDVLAGTIAGLLAQGVTPLDAAGVGVYLHGAAAGLLASELGDSGLLASELARGVARVAARLRAGELA